MSARDDTLPLAGAPGAGAAGATVRLHGLALDVAGFSEQGPRAENQDAYALESLHSAGFVAVADGMGGERSGRLAARTALEALLAAGPIRSLEDARRAARAADGAVTAAAEREPDAHSGMGCALALLALVPTRADGPFWVGAHVGDVRIISLAPDGTPRLETRDHTPAFASWEAGEIELDAVPEAQGANRLQRAVGRGGEADAIWIPARPGWAYGLLSDGVTKAMRLDELGRALGAPTAAAACDAIRRKVEERGADDNFTAIVVRVADTRGGPAARAAAAPSASTPQSMSASSVAPRSRSTGIVVLGLLCLLALLAAGAAFWTARELGERSAERAEVERLRTGLDSLRARIEQLEEPFGPVTADPRERPATPAVPPP